VTVTVRRVREEDAAATIELLSPIIASRAYSIMTELIPYQDQLDFIRSVRNEGVGNVAVDETGEIVGFQTVGGYFSETPALAHIGDIGTFVRLGYHRAGIGGMLMEKTIPEAVAKGFLKVMALIRADNPAALGFYRRHGFETIGTARRHARIDDRFIDEVMAERMLVG